MYKIITSLLVVLCASEASADSCPDRYRFVDFGLEDSDGIIRRGGTILRAFDLEGTHLLVPERTICLSVDEVARDGRGLPIPVVSSVDIDPKVTAIDLTELRLRAVKDVAAAAEANASLHHEKLAQSGTITTRGQNFLCASTNGTDDLSCQISTPYGGNVPLVIYCDAQLCEMPVMGRDEQLVGSAAWRREAADPGAAGIEISDKVQRIHDFLEEQF